MFHGLGACSTLNGNVAHAPRPVAQTKVDCHIIIIVSVDLQLFCRVCDLHAQNNAQDTHQTPQSMELFMHILQCALMLQASWNGSV